MNKASEPVLELLDAANVVMTAGGIDHELQNRLSDPPGRTTIFRALDELEDHGLVCRPDSERQTLIRITDDGRKFLAGELDAGELTESEE